MALSVTSVEKIILAEPRGFCAGVDRAVEAVRSALRSYGRPLYVRHQIVHNRFVLEALEKEGAIFVESLDEVPTGQRVIFSAHGVAPSEWDRAKDRDLRVIDATCPLVTKVHLEVKKYDDEGRTVILIGHAGHEEVKGTLGVAPGKVVLVGSVAEARTVPVENGDRIAAVTQTTLSVDDTREIMETLKDRFPTMQAPKTDDICYATQNRQNAVKELVQVSDAVLVVGSKQSSNANRLVEVARMRGARAFLVDSIADVEPSMLEGVRSLGLTASASSPEWLVEEIIGAFARSRRRGRVVERRERARPFPPPNARRLSSPFTNATRVTAPESKGARRAQLCASHWVQGSPLPPAAQAIIPRQRFHRLRTLSTNPARPSRLDNSAPLLADSSGFRRTLRGSFRCEQLSHVR